MTDDRTPLWHWRDTLGVRAVNALRNAGLETVEDVAARTPRELSAIPDLGATSLRRIDEALLDHHAARPAVPPSTDTVTVDESVFSRRATNLLRNAGLRTLEEVAGHSRGELAAIRNMGERSLSEIDTALRSRGLDYAPEPPPEPPWPPYRFETVIRPLRRVGMTYREIAARCYPPITPSRVQQLWAKWATDDDRSAYEASREREREARRREEPE